MHLIPKPKIFF